MQHSIYRNFFEVDHPLVKHKLNILRDKNTSKKGFKELIYEITILLAYEATRDLMVTDADVETPLEICKSDRLAGKKPVIVPILRAGIGMVDAFLTLMPSARVGHIGLYRNEETLKPNLYYIKVPSSSCDRQYYICDPMLATGGSAISAIEELKKIGIKKIVFVCIVSAPEGVERIYREFPDVKIFSASLDRGLNNKGYILPGLGDAGDRIFGTK